MSNDNLRPGEEVPQSGQYLNSKTKTEVTLVQGKTVPPGPEGSTFKLVDPTKHKPPKK